MPSIDPSIKNIIFDFGGVILNIDYSLTQAAFEKFGVTDFKNIYSQKEQITIFDDFEKGNISPAEFRRLLKKSIPHKINDAQFDAAWNAMLLDLPGERVELLDKLKGRHRLFLLSNTNAIHFDFFSAYIKSRFKRDLFADVFEKAYVSHAIHMRKPDTGIFEFVLRENNLKREETLFIDDSIQHIEGARKAGLQALHLEKGKTILDIFG